ncbi:unnamed protein product [Arabidopsis thaliana]|uniref:DUF1204 domain-containing protein n=1 Tax=Arabidopsis thaliana TaxID=3702 RepID=A0A654G609_ARATH|nr:unnamed protein product [Arabidopsis thaliana]
MKTALRFCSAPRGLVARVPETHERPWTTPEGYMCIYEKFLTECGLSFPIPIFLLGFVARRKMALSQLTVAAIRYAVGLIRLAEQCGVEVRRSHYEEVINLKRIGSARPGFYYAQSAMKPKIITRVKSKTNDWCFEYFFVKVTKESVGDYEMVDLSEWRMTPSIRRLKILDPFPDELKEDLLKIRAVSPYVWPTSEDKERLSLHKPKKARKTPAKRKKMKINTEEVGSYSSRYKRQKTSAPRESQERDRLPSGEDRAVRWLKKKGVLPDPSPREAIRDVTREKELAAARQGKQREGSARSDVPPGCNTLVVHPGPVNDPHHRRSSAAIEEIRPDARGSKQPDYRWEHYYSGRKVPITSDAESCADLFRKISYGPTPFPEVKELKEMKAFTDVARKTFDVVGSMNRLAYLYERRFRNMEVLGSQDLRGELDAEKRKNDELLKKLESASKETAHLKNEVATLVYQRTVMDEERDR